MSRYNTMRFFERVAIDEVARGTARQWDGYGRLAVNHLREVWSILDAEEPGYRS